MILADVNALVYAFNEDVPEHGAYSPWLRSALSAGEGFALVDATLSGFIRIVTNPRIWSTPASTGDALGFVDSILDAPAASWLPANGSVWATFSALASGDKAIRGNLVPDAYLAALALCHGARIATADRGFARFPGLKWFDPADAIS